MENRYANASEFIEHLPRARPIPDAVPFKGYWYDNSLKTVREFNVHYWETLPSLADFREMEPNDAYLSTLFCVWKEHTQDILEFLHKSKEPSVIGKWDFDDWADQEVELARSSHRPQASKTELVQPSGSFDAQFGLLTHYPTFRTRQQGLGETLDESNPSMNIIAKKLHNATKETLIVDMFMRRETTTLRKTLPKTKTPMTEIWSRELFKHHFNFSTGIMERSKVKVWAVLGQHPEQHWMASKKPKDVTESRSVSSYMLIQASSQRTIIKKSFYMPNSEMKLTSAIQFDSNHKIEQMFFFGGHPESLIRPSGRLDFRNKGSKFDDAINFAAAVAGIEIDWRYGEAYYVKTCLARDRDVPPHTDPKQFAAESDVRDAVCNNLKQQGMSGTLDSKKSNVRQALQPIDPNIASSRPPMEQHPSTVSNPLTVSKVERPKIMTAIEGAMRQRAPGTADTFEGLVEPGVMNLLYSEEGELDEALKEITEEDLAAELEPIDDDEYVEITKHYRDVIFSLGRRHTQSFKQFGTGQGLSGRDFKSDGLPTLLAMRLAELNSGIPMKFSEFPNHIHVQLTQCEIYCEKDLRPWLEKWSELSLVLCVLRLLKQCYTLGGKFGGRPNLEAAATPIAWPPPIEATGQKAPAESHVSESEESEIERGRHFQKKTKYSHLIHKPDGSDPNEPLQVTVRCPKCFTKRIDEHPTYTQDSKYVQRNMSCDVCPRDMLRGGKKLNIDFPPVDSTMRTITATVLNMRVLRAERKTSKEEKPEKLRNRRPPKISKTLNAVPVEILEDAVARREDQVKKRKRNVILDSEDEE